MATYWCGITKQPFLISLCSTFSTSLISNCF